MGTHPTPEDAHRTLVANATRGDPVAVDDLLTRHLPGLLSFLRRHANKIVLAKESLSDLAQSVCREALERSDGYEYQGEAAFVSWFHKIALTKIVDKHRYHIAMKRDVRREVKLAGSDTSTDPATIGDVYATFASPDEIAIRGEEARRIAAGFDQLSPEHQEVIFLHRIMELPHREIGEQMGRNEEASRALLARAIARLGMILGTGRS